MTSIEYNFAYMMMPPVPEISPAQLAQKLADCNPLIILDVREAWELGRAGIQDERVFHASMSVLANQGVNVLPDLAEGEKTEIIVICHHGIRSAQVTAWLKQAGWRNVFSLAGGLEGYASQVDASIGRY